MTIRASEKNGLSMLHIEGEMTIYTAATLKDELMPYLAKPCEREIELSDVSEMDTAGLQLLILAKREARRHNTPLRLSGHSPAVLEVLNLCNMTGFFGDPIWETEKAKV